MTQDHQAALNLLLVEDNPGDARLAQEALRTSPFDLELTVSSVNRLSEAITALRRERFDIILLDLGLPDSEGLDTLDLLLPHASGVPVVVLTGLDDGEIAVEALRRGAQDYLPKPQLESDVLGRIVAYAVERQRALVEVQTARERAEHAALNDALTGLGNRAYFHEQLSAAIARAERRSGSLAVVFMDLDRFKLVNDSLGHTVGDELLRKVADRIGATLRAEDAVARLGGDEFAVLMSGRVKKRDVAVAVERMLEAVRPPIAVRGHEINITASAGVSLFPSSGASVDELLKSADIAMYRAKENGRDRVEFASSELSARVSARQRLEQRLWSGMEKRAFELHFQPIVSLRYDQVVGGEALLRWRDGSKLVSAANFIPIAEESGLIVQLGDWIIEDALTHLSEWSASGLSDVYVAVNVSPNQFFYGDIVATFLQAIERTGVSPEQVVVELTESAVAGDIQSIADRLSRLKDIGCKIAIDDFGIGHSSLNHLATLPIDVLKIDQSFVRGLPHQAIRVAIVEGVVELARRLGIRVIAEGVENDEQLEFLRHTGCDAVQGFHLSHALPASEFASFARTARRSDLAA